MKKSKRNTYKNQVGVPMFVFQMKIAYPEASKMIFWLALILIDVEIIDFVSQLFKITTILLQ